MSANPFDKFGITHLSPSSLNLYCANPALWVGKYLMGWRDESGPAAFRGSAIEAGLDVFLFEQKGEEATQRARAKFLELTQGQADEAHEEELANVGPMLAQAMTALKDFGTPLARQVRAEYQIEGVEVPVVGYIDYSFPEFDLDLKTTKACPSSIKADHGRQFSLYRTARDKPIKALYVTAKKFAIYDLSDEDAGIHMADMTAHAKAIRHLLANSKNARDAAKFFAVERSDFRWSPATLELATAL